ncbi:hypothetical protein Tco_0975624 [Tanacetum coccineum]|uniref:Uncharacterized protein n=1 Tax=Tanacetum coccineum TaxID=301880 RepID=A0ABQ5EG56_9ASTR
MESATIVARARECEIGGEEERVRERWRRERWDRSAGADLEYSELEDGSWMMDEEMLRATVGRVLNALYRLFVREETKGRRRDRIREKKSVERCR